MMYLCHDKSKFCDSFLSRYSSFIFCAENAADSRSSKRAIRFNFGNLQIAGLRNVNVTRYDVHCMTLANNDCDSSITVITIMLSQSVLSVEDRDLGVVPKVGNGNNCNSMPRVCSRH